MRKAERVAELGKPQAFVVRTAHGEYWIEYRVKAPHLLARVVVPNAPRHPVYLRSIFLGKGDRRFVARGVFTVSAASSDAPETALTFAWTDRTPPTRPRLRAVEGSRGSAVVVWKASRDAGSGMAGYRVLVDGRAVETTSRARRRAVLPLRPGAHRITIEAFDRAGNRSSSTARVPVS